MYVMFKGDSVVLRFLRFIIYRFMV